MATGGAGDRKQRALALKLFGFEIDVEWSFAATALIPLGAGRTVLGCVQWLVLALVSVVAHELGHAFVARRFGAHPTITLVWFGGQTRLNARAMTRSQELAVFVAGPLASFAFGALALAAHYVVPQHRSELTHSIITDATFMGFAWGVLNLVPVLPQDGSQIVRSLLGRRSFDPFTLFDVIASALVLVASTLVLSQIELLEKRTLYFTAAAALLYQGILLWDVFEARADAAHARTLDELSASLAAEHDDAIRDVEALLPKLRSRAARWRALRMIANAHFRAKRYRQTVEAIDRLPSGSWIEEHVTVESFVKTEQPERALAFARARNAADPSPYSRRLLLYSLSHAGLLDEALAIDLAVVDDDGRWVAPALTDALFRARRYADAVQWLQRVVARYDQAGDAYNLACAYALQGQPELAVRALESAIDRGYYNRAHLEADEDLRSILGRPDVQALIERMPTAAPVPAPPLKLNTSAPSPQTAVAYARVTK
ncbi:MAG: hypothetical protein JNK05_17655 [Myxococcales bacterium]|nr:hypothetical protein [Myxococcales bacterium]